MKNSKNSKNSVWIDREEYPFESQFHKVKGGRMHYVDVGRGQPIVLVHGAATWSFVYRNLIKGLSGEYRCIAPDHLGFGLSDKPKKYSYKPEAHADNLDCLIQHLNLKNIILVVHDYGGPIGLNYALQNPHNVSRIVLMNTWMWPIQEEPYARKASRLANKRWGKFLYERLNYPTRYLLKKAVADKANLPKLIHEQYIRALPTPESRQGSLIFARELAGSHAWFDMLWRQRESIQDIPTLLLWGMQDPFIPLDALDVWNQFFTHQRMIRLANAGHLVQEDQKTNVCGLIKDFLQEEHPQEESHTIGHPC